MKSPCYDPVSKVDCPRRGAGCSVGCPDWANYITERDLEYKRRLKEMRTTRDVLESHKSRQNIYHKKVIRNRMRGNKQ